MPWQKRSDQSSTGKQREGLSEKDGERERERERERQVEIYVTGESASIACCKRAGSCPLLATWSQLLICD